MNIYETRAAAGITAVTPNDATDLPGGPTRGVYAGVAVIMADGSTGTFTAAANGEHHWKVRRILTTGTTATNMLALY
jgi:hypothetical protein